MPPTDLCCHASNSFPHNPLFFNCVYSWAPFSSTRSSFQQSYFVFSYNIPSLNVLRVGCCCALWRKINCWLLHLIYLLICAEHATLFKVGLCGQGLTHTFCLAQGHKGHQRTAVPGVVGSPNKADYSVRVSVSLLSNLTAKRSYGRSYIFFSGIDWSHCVISVLNYNYLRRFDESCSCNNWDFF